MKRSTALFEHLAACHLRTAKTSADLNLYTLCTHSHSCRDSHLDGSTVRDTSLHLSCNVVCNDICIQLRTFNLKDVNLNLLVGDLLQLLFKFVNLLTALANNNARTCSVDSNCNEFESSLNNYLREAGLCKTSIQILSNLCILQNLGSIIGTTVPIGVPTTDNTKSVAYWINFLSHIT